MRYMVRWLILAVAILVAPVSTVNVANAQTTKITSLSAIADTAIASDDVLYLIDISSVGTEDKKVAIEELSQAAFTQRLFQSESSGTGGQSILTNPSVNSIAAGSYNNIVGGGYTSWPQIISGTESLRDIYGGYDNEIGASIACSIVAGKHCGVMDADGNANTPGARTVAAGSGHATIVGAANSFIDTANYNVGVGGTANIITSGRGSAWIGGEGCTLIGDYMTEVGAKDFVFTNSDSNRSAAIASATFTGADDLDYTTVLSAFNGDIDSTDWVIFGADQAGDVDGISYGLIAGNNNIDVANSSYVLVAGSQAGGTYTGVTGAGSNKRHIAMIASDNSGITSDHQHQVIIGAADAVIEDGNFTFLHGYGPKAAFDGAVVHGGGYFGAAIDSAGTAGTAQVTRAIVKREINTTSLTELRISNNSGDPDGTNTRITLADDDRAVLVHAKVVAIQDDGTDCSAWEIKALVQINGGTVSVIGGSTATLLHQSAGASNWQCDLTTGGASTDTISIRGAADTGETVRFVAHVEMTEVGE